MLGARRLGIACVAGALVAAGVVTAAPADQACSKATARQVAEPFFVWGNDVRDPVAQVLCGPFTGLGSEAMAVTFAAPTCWPTQGWAVYRRSGDGWKLVLARRGAFIFPLVTVGSTIRETAPVFRAGDPRCIPSGGRHARIWHWNGGRLAAGPWKQVGKGTPAANPTGGKQTGYFKTPSGNIVCFYVTGKRADPPLVVCGIRSGLKPAPPRRPCAEGGYAGDRVVLLAAGRVDVPSCAGDPGPFLGLQVGARVLAYGRSWSGSGIRCTSAVTGLTCRNTSGHGFFLSRERWRSF
jgi:hypothetical protein